MLKSIQVKLAQGRQYIGDPRTAAPASFRGLPLLSEAPCGTGCARCKDACPTDAIALDPLRLDVGRCVFCTECAVACPIEEKITFTNNTRMGAVRRDVLVMREGQRALDPIAVSASLRRQYGRSLKLRSVSAGGCNGCELELNALANVQFDIGRWGIDFVASPRHADGLVLSGPLTKNMLPALRLCWDGMPAPKLVLAVGACAVSGGLYRTSDVVDRTFLDEFTPSLYVPGCPPHPLTFVTAVLDVLGIS